MSDVRPTTEADWALYDQLVVEPEPCDDGMHYAIHGTVEGLAAAVRVLVGRLTETDFFAVIEAGTAKLNPVTHTALSACQEALVERLLGDSPAAVAPPPHQE
jgi:hypothetical protein